MSPNPDNRRRHNAAIRTVWSRRPRRCRRAFGGCRARGGADHPVPSRPAPRRRPVRRDGRVSPATEERDKSSCEQDRPWRRTGPAHSTTPGSCHLPGLTGFFHLSACAGWKFICAARCIRLPGCTIGERRGQITGSTFATRGRIGSGLTPNPDWRTAMELGMIGLGRMGANMAERLVRDRHRVVGFDMNPQARNRAAVQGIELAPSIEALAQQLSPPRAVWLMVPSGAAVDETITALLPALAPGDTIIDGGNSYYKDSQRRARMVAEKRLNYLDAGTSGGIWGLPNGYSIMVGGSKPAAERLRPIFETLAPAPNKGWGHVGPSGAGHFVKMIHNGIEYGMMQAYAEGFSLMHHKQEFALDLQQAAEIWRDGSVVRSWLLDLAASALRDPQALRNIAAFVADSGEGRWTVFEAVDLDVPAPVITLSLLERLRSRDPDSFSDKLLAALRNEFGGHGVKQHG